MRAAHNRRRAKRLLRGFDRAVALTQGFLNSRYGSPLAHKLITEARQEYARIIPDLPDLHGSKPHAKFITATGWFLAFHRALAQNGRPVREAGEFAYALTAQYIASLPRGAAPLIRWLWFSKLFQELLRFRAKQSQTRRQRGDFVYEYVEGDGQRFDFGVNYVECAIWTFLKSQGAPELAPYMCALDQLYSDAFGWGLVRSTTLAEGGPRCDFRFKCGGETKLTSTVLPLREQ
jgi:hypothetical protein